MGRARTVTLVAVTVVFVLATAVALVLQRSLLAPLPLAVPDFVALLVAVGAVAYGPRVGAGWGLLAGVLADLTPPATGIVGAWALAYVCCGFGLGLLQERRRSWPSRAWYAVAVAAVAVLATVLHALVLAVFSDVVVWPPSVVPAMLLTGVYGAMLGLVAGPPLVWLLTRPPLASAQSRAFGRR